MIMNGSSAVRTRLVSGTDKAKFTVFVRGHQWSSARHTHESLQEFSKVIEKNARKLGFIKQDDKVDRLQLAESADGTDPEELDVDATLEDVLICMGKKKLVALITPRAHPELSQEKGQYALRDLQTDYGPNSRSNTLSVDISTHEAGTFSLATPTSAPSCREELCRMQNSLEVRTMDSPIISATMPMQSQASTYFVGKTPSNHLSTTVEEPPQGDFQTAMHAKGLQISISDTNLEQISSPTINLINNSYQTSAQASTNYLQNGNIMLPSIIHPSSLATPSPAELAQLLVQTSPSQYFTPGLNADTKCLSNSPFLENPSRLLNEVLELSQPQSLAPSQTFPPFNSLVPPGWINSCVKPINPMFVTGSSLKFPAPNIAVLAQFLSSQLKAFVPSTESNHSTSTLPTTNGAQLQSSTSNFVSHGTDAGMPHRTQNAGNLMDNIFLTNNNQTGDRSPCSNQDNKNCSVESEPDKDQSSSSVIDAQQNAQSQQEMIFLVNRRSKTGAGTHRLRMSELSTHFHLSVVDAAKKLGVSQTTLKKACRKFGLKRWPGRKVRSLESTINGLEHTIAVGQGAGMEELTEAQIRSEVLKLQQEMDHLVHGLPPMQHPTALRTADLYKRLYSQGWRSKNNSPEGINMIYVDETHAAAANNRPSSTLTSCSSGHRNVEATETSSSPQEVSIFSKPDETDHGMLTDKPAIDGQDSNAVNRSSDYPHDTSCQWISNTKKSIRSKRKRKFWSLEDNQFIQGNINKDDLNDNPWKASADFNAENSNCLSSNLHQGVECAPKECYPGDDYVCGIAAAHRKDSNQKQHSNPLRLLPGLDKGSRNHSN